MAKIDREIDFHHYTREQMRTELDRLWGSGIWRGLRRIRIIHGTGLVLAPEVRLWCEEKGLAWTIEPRNPGVTILLPGRQEMTPSPPPHRPMARLKQQMPYAERTKPESTLPSTSNTQHTDLAADDARLFAEEIERISRADSDALKRRKNV